MKTLSKTLNSIPTSIETKPKGKKKGAHKKKRDFAYVTQPGARRTILNHGFSQGVKSLLQLHLQTNATIFQAVIPVDGKALLFSTHTGILKTIDDIVGKNEYKLIRGSRPLLQWISAIKKPINIIPLVENVDKFDDRKEEFPSPNANSVDTTSNPKSILKNGTNDGNRKVKSVSIKKSPEIIRTEDGSDTMIVTDEDDDDEEEDDDEEDDDEEDDEMDE
jgi:hypothetical protein